MGRAPLKIPDGMRKAHSEVFRNSFQAGLCSYVSDVVFDAMLEAALRWLIDNPMTPTPEQASHLQLISTVQDVCKEWQKLMFQEQLSPFVSEVAERMRGHVLNKSEADYLIMMIRLMERKDG